MNKAFVREPDHDADYCPRCGAKGQPVGRDTLLVYLPPAKAQAVADPANFCPTPQCEVAYFDVFERIVLVADLISPVYPKDPDAPMCACFGLTRHEIDQDIAEGGVTRVRAILEKAKSPEARCAQKAANGQSCAAYVQRYYMQHKNATS
jgi:hypothetical protein